LTAPAGSRRRAAAVLAAAALAVLLAISAIVAVATRPTTLSPPAPSPLPAPSSPTAPSSSAAAAVDGWDVAAQTELAARPMPVLPEAAALPHALSTSPAGPPIQLPAPTGRRGPVPSGFPGTAEGALAQLVALTSAGLVGGDPQTYDTAHDAIAATGAPPANSTRLHRDLVAVRAQGGLPPTGAVPDVAFDWTPTSGLIKGSTDGGRYVVVCALGQLDVSAGGRTFSSGAGDCQAVRWVGGVGSQWQISPGTPAAPAPLAWPGSAEADQIGYREVHSERGPR
jgi:hypothetical protein